MCFGTFNKMLEPFYLFFSLDETIKSTLLCVSVLFIFQKLIDEIGVVNTSFLCHFNSLGEIFVLFLFFFYSRNRVVKLSADQAPGLRVNIPLTAMKRMKERTQTAANIIF